MTVRGSFVPRISPSFSRRICYAFTVLGIYVDLVFFLVLGFYVAPIAEWMLLA